MPTAYRNITAETKTLPVNGYFVTNGRILQGRIFLEHVIDTTLFGLTLFHSVINTAGKSYRDNHQQ